MTPWHIGDSTWKFHRADSAGPGERPFTLRSLVVLHLDSPVAQRWHLSASVTASKAAASSPANNAWATSRPPLALAAPAPAALGCWSEFRNDCAAIACSFMHVVDAGLLGGVEPRRSPLDRRDHRPDPKNGDGAL
jgi:hypothetical protein